MAAAVTARTNGAKTPGQVSQKYDVIIESLGTLAYFPIILPHVYHNAA